MVAPIIWVSGLVASMAGYANAIVNHLSGKDNREHQKDLQKDALADRLKDRDQAAKHHQELLAFQKENAKNQLDAILQAARIQSQATLAIPELNKKYANWPLLTVPSDILEQHLKDTQPPLLVMPVFQGFGDDDLSTIPTQFLQTHYKRSGDRPVEVLDHNWLPHIPIGGGSIKAIFSAVKSQPCLFVLVQRNKEKIKLRIAGWGFNPPFAFDEIVIPDSSGQELLRFYAKQQARDWEKEREKYLEAGKGKSLEDIDKDYNPKAAYNLAILKEQEDLEAKGCDGSQRSKAYMVDDDEIVEQAATVIAKCSALWCAFFTDMHYLLYNNLPPQLPHLLPELTEGIADLPIIQDSIREILTCYRAILDEMKAIRSALVPDLAVNLATALVNIYPDNAQSNLDYALASWLHVHSHERPDVLAEFCLKGTDAMLDLTGLVIKLDRLDEWDFLKCLRRTYTILGDSAAITQIRKIEHDLEEAIIYDSHDELTDSRPGEVYENARRSDGEKPQFKEDVDYTRLEELLQSSSWAEADRETYRRMLEVVGRENDRYIIQFLDFPISDLRKINGLWVKYSNGRFGFSVQKKIYVEIGGKLDGYYPGHSLWQNFGDRVGWRVNGSWRKEHELIFDIKAPYGHLPCAPLLGEYKWDRTRFHTGGYGLYLFSHVALCKS